MKGWTPIPGLDLPPEHYADNVWPAAIPEFSERTLTWFAQAGRVARTLTEIFADALGLPAGYFAPFTDHSLDVLRMNNYALPPQEIDLDADLTGMGEHTDYGIVTVLWADRVAGLQVLADDGKWHDVMPQPGALLVNLGDLTARWTNEIWRSTLHRVKPPVVERPDRTSSVGSLLPRRKRRCGHRHPAGRGRSRVTSSCTNRSPWPTTSPPSSTAPEIWSATSTPNGRRPG